MKLYNELINPKPNCFCYDVRDGVGVCLGTTNIDCNQCNFYKPMEVKKDDKRQ